MLIGADEINIFLTKRPCKWKQKDCKSNYFIEIEMSGKRVYMAVGAQ